MKWILLAILILTNTQINAKTTKMAPKNLLLSCLAREEELFHKKKLQNALSNLNQTFLNEVAMNDDITLKKNFIDSICNNKEESPSLAFLHLLLMKEGDIYDLSLAQTENSMKAFKMGHIEEFQKQVPHMLIEYISKRQAELPNADCLKKAIPEIDYLSEKLKYLEGEVSIHQILNDKKKIDLIFEKLKKFDDIKKQCIINYQKKLDLIKKNNQKAQSVKN